LGRDTFAHALADELLTVPTASGYVIGLVGPWGSGKTSIVNMTIDAIGDRATVLQFNPWMFSGTDALVTSFFGELSKQMKQGPSKLKKVASQLAAYGETLSPLAGLVGATPVAEVATNAIKRLGAGPSLLQQRAALKKALGGLDRPLVVVVDDVDRLAADEVRDVVRLVRLVGDFPNTVYLLAFDRARMEECLGGGDREYGRAYLEKIVQVTHDVPTAIDVNVAELALTGIGKLVETAPTGPFSRPDWENAFAYLIRPLLLTPRHVVRYLQSLPMTLRLIGDEVALADVLALEAIRVLKPAAFTAIVNLADTLTSTRDPQPYAGRHGHDPKDGPLGELVMADESLVGPVCRCLFPAARRYLENMHFGPEWQSTWRRERRVANPSVLRFYLERRLPPGVVPAAIVDALVGALGEPDHLQQQLEALTSAELYDALTRLAFELETLEFDEGNAVEDDIAVTSIPSVLIAMRRLPHRQPGMFGEPVSVTIGRVVIRLLRRVPEAARPALVAAVFDAIPDPSAMLFFLQLVGNQKGVGQGMVTVELEQEFADRIRDRAITMPITELAAHLTSLDLPQLLSTTEDGREYLRVRCADDAFMRALIMAARGDIRSASQGSVSVTTTEVLSWSWLTKLVPEDVVRHRASELVTADLQSGPETTAAELSTLMLAVRYATGWRPEGDPEVRAERSSAPADGEADDSAQAMSGGAAELTVIADDQGSSPDGESDD
jgi:hypothetical protein